MHRATHVSPRTRYACTKHVGHTRVYVLHSAKIVVGKSPSGPSPELPVRRRRRRSRRRATMTGGGRSAANRVCRRRRVVRTSTRIRAGTWPLSTVRLTRTAHSDGVATERRRHGWRSHRRCCCGHCLVAAAKDDAAADRGRTSSYTVVTIAAAGGRGVRAAVAARAYGRLW